MKTLEIQNRANKTHVLDMLNKARRIILGEVVIQELEEINKDRTPRNQIYPDWPDLDPAKIIALQRIGFTVEDDEQLTFPISDTGTATIAPEALDMVIEGVNRGFPTAIPRGPKAGKNYLGSGGSINPGWSVPVAHCVPGTYCVPEGRYYEILTQRLVDMAGNVQRSSGKLQKAFRVELELLEDINELM